LRSIDLFTREVMPALREIREPAVA
jgi:hypothetical protein